MSKYHAKRVEFCGMVFDSQKEFTRWQELCLLEKAGVITDLMRQVPFELIPAQRRNGKTVERAVRYVADFVYRMDGKEIVEDVKGLRTRDYIIKRKMMLFISLNLLNFYPVNV